MSAPADRIRRFLDDTNPPTPVLVVDVDAVVDRYAECAGALPDARLLYAVKANPEPAVITALAAAGSGFDVASPAEITRCLEHGARPETLSYGNTVKKPADIAFAHASGVRRFVTDAPGDLAAIAEHAPGAEITVRLEFTGPDSATPFGGKFGCSPGAATDLLVRAAELGLDPAGVGFHPGSQQTDLAAWDSAIAAAAGVVRAAEARGVRPRLLNTGGGFGVSYRDPAPSFAVYADAITTAMRAHFGERRPELAIEPGRALVADAGLIRAEVVLIAERSRPAGYRWVYLDIGRYNGMAETENEAIHYRLDPIGRAGSGGPVILAGPTCDGDDVLYQHTPYRLPLSLRAGDRIDILAAGAYTASYSSVEFNGIPPLRTYCLSGGRSTR